MCCVWVGLMVLGGSSSISTLSFVCSFWCSWDFRFCSFEVALLVLVCGFGGLGVCVSVLVPY